MKNTIDLFKSFLKNRTQFTSITQLQKPIMPNCKSGVSQVRGSILGPLLFLIYIYDMYRVTTSRDALFCFKLIVWIQILKKIKF